MKFKVDTWPNLVDELSSNQNRRNVWTVIRNLCLVAAVYYIWQERNLRLFQNSKREANDLADIMIEELKAKMVSIAVKNSNNVLLAELIWNEECLKVCPLVSLFSKGVFGLESGNLNSQHLHLRLES
ncbi:hypothetical protein Tco_1334949 [Tanacetum coccineum]